MRRAKRTDGTAMGDVLPLEQIRALVVLVPRFGDKAGQRLTSANSLSYSAEFWLDKYFEKELFFALNTK